MFQSKMVLRTTCALAPLVLAACAAAVPDLAPAGTPNARPVDLCNIAKDGPDKGKLIVTVRNDGVRAAPPTTTVVEFRGMTPTPETVRLPTPQIAGSTGATRLVVPIPPSCYEPTTRNCYFKITVDADKASQEINQANNASWGVCSS